MTKKLVPIGLNSQMPYLKLKDPTDSRMVLLTKVGRDWIVNDAEELARLIGIEVPFFIENSYELDKVVDDFQVCMEDRGMPSALDQRLAMLDADGFVHSITMFFKLPAFGDQERFLLVHYNPRYV